MPLAIIITKFEEILYTQEYPIMDEDDAKDIVREIISDFADVGKWVFKSKGSKKDCWKFVEQNNEEIEMRCFVTQHVKIEYDHLEDAIFPI